ncbi:MAG TPA: hypothetical protein ENH12_04485 [Proteobacteria bacterium]|nr:hypothetical protein [Pseudomonadota bacterium]
MNMIRNIFIALALLASSAHLSVHAGEDGYPAWDFKDPGDLKGWVGEGIRDSGTNGESFILSGEDKVQLRFPSGLSIDSEKDNYLRIRIRISSPRIIQVFWATERPGKQLPAIPFTPYRDQHFHTYWIDLSESLEWIGRIEMMGLAFFGQPGWLEMDYIEIRPFSLSAYLSDQWSELWIPRNLHLGTINSLNSPRFFNKPFISWLNKIAVLILLIGAVLYYRASKTNRIKIISRIGLAILAIWIIYDLWDTYSQFKIVEEINQTYIQPPPEKKTFPALGDFYRFVEFCRRYIPDDSAFNLLPKPNWPFDCRLRYFLYPARVDREMVASYFRNSLPKYFIVYNTPGIIFDSVTGRLMTRDEKTVYSEKGRLVSRYNPSSFIYKVEEGEY